MAAAHRLTLRPIAASGASMHRTFNYARHLVVERFWLPGRRSATAASSVRTLVTERDGSRGSRVQPVPRCCGGLRVAGQVLMFGLCWDRYQPRRWPAITTAEWTLRSGRTRTSSPGASMRQPLSPSSCSEAVTTDSAEYWSGTCTDEVELRTCRPVVAAGRSRMCRAHWPG